MKHPIENIVWKNPQALNANDYNPNVVLKKEMQLLEFSLKKNGWIQPVLITKDNVIIDGFHRATLARLNNWQVPCVVMDITEAERMLLTIRINRAKGSHVALKMADIVKELHHKHKYSVSKICEGIGADKSEIELLLLENVFEKKDTKNHVYSKAWYPV